MEVSLEDGRKRKYDNVQENTVGSSKCAVKKCPKLEREIEEGEVEDDGEDGATASDDTFKVKFSLIKTEPQENDDDDQSDDEGKFAENGGGNSGARSIKKEMGEQDKSQARVKIDYGKDGNDCKRRKLNPEEEVNKLKEFLVLDEVAQESDKEARSDSGSGYDDVPGDEVEEMLDGELPEGYAAPTKPRTCPYDHKKKIVLEEKGVNHFEVLPLGWVTVPHHSGMPLYLHQTSRVCTMAKPYFLGPGSARKHEIPISAIPCYNYRRALEEEAANAGENKKTKEVDPVQEPSGDPKVVPEPCSQNGKDEASDATDKKSDKSSVDSSKVVNHDLLKKLVNPEPVLDETTPLPNMPSAKVETAQENWKKFHLQHDEVTEYCKKLFKFKVISILRFTSWSERRKFTKSRKALRRPTLPDGTKLITFPLQNNAPVGTSLDTPGVLCSGPKIARRDCLMNPSGKSYVCILHEYLQRGLKKQPTYEFKELENGATPYSASLSIDDMRYGIGYGTSKRQAKSAAAKAAIEILIPEMRDKITQDKNINGTASRSNDRDLAFFDDIAIEDPRVADFCTKTMEPSPHNVLQTCLSRNFGIGDCQIKYEINTLHHHKNQFTMSVGKHTASVVCQNKRDGKQRASQAILQALHPNVTSWGSLLRLYGTRSVKSFKEKKQEEQEITLLQSHAALNQPNYAILDKLRAEMTKLLDKDHEVTPIGTLLCREDLPTHTGSNLNNVDL